MTVFLLSEKIKQKFPVSRGPEKGSGERRQAAVLVILFTRNDQAFVLMIKRAGHLERHAGEIAFPGGMFDEEDKDLLHTALRETLEELEMEMAGDSVVGRLTTVTTASGVDVTPFVAMSPLLPAYKINSAEVELALEIPLKALLATRQKGLEPNAEIFRFQEHRIWGASARILLEVAQLGIL